MKRICKIMLLIIALRGYTAAIQAQNLDSMPQAKRDSLLISVATETILRYGPGYYREYKEPIIERNKDADGVYYRVTFLYDTIKERLEYDFAAVVVIGEDTGKPSSIRLGGTVLVRIISENEWDSNAVIEQTPYQEMVFPIYDMEHPEKKEPKNIDELRRKGFEEVNGQWVKTKKNVPPNIDILKRKGYEEINGRWVKTKKGAIK